MAAGSALPFGDGSHPPRRAVTGPGAEGSAPPQPAAAGPGAAAGPPAGSGAFGRLVERLRAGGVPADARAMADALWLAQWITRPERSAPAEDPGLSDAPPPDRPLSAITADASPPHPEEPGPVAADRDQQRTGARSIALLAVEDTAAAPGPGSRRLGEVAVPVAAALPGLLPLQRALRPIQRYQPPVSPARRELDEAATAELSARSEMVVPVLRGVRRRAAGLRLLMDGSASMAVWEQTLRELRHVCERLGAFHDVTVHYLRPLGEDVGVAPGPGPTAPVRPAAQLHDPTGHHLTLVVSDCAGPLWRDGRMQRLLHTWVADAPVAVVQPLPQRMWGHTLLPAVAGTLLRRQGPYRALAFEPARRRRAAAAVRRGARRERPVPVLSPAPAALGTWARLAAADAGLSLRGAAAMVRADHGTGVTLAPALGAHGTAPTDPAARVAAFEQTASPDARHLAVQLSAVPLCLPVMQLVQRAMLPHTGPAELAEVLLSGLVEQTGPAGGEDGPPPAGPGGQDGTAGAAGPWYSFAPGVRDELLARLSATEAALVLKHCSLYVERTYGRGARNFPAVAVAVLAGGSREPETGAGAVPEPFARVSERVLRRFEPALRTTPPAAQADGTPDGRFLLARFEQEGDARDLLEALRLLRAEAADAPVTAGTPWPGTDLARALLHGWTTWRRPDSLAEAEQAARDAVAHTVPRGDQEHPRALLALAEVCAARARERHEAEDAEGERAALTTGAGALRTACATMVPPDERLTPALCLRADLLRRLAALPAPEPGGPAEDEDPLADAETSLTAVMERWQGGAEVPGALYAARGTVLLDHARRSGAGAGRSAVRAAADLTTALRLLPRERAGDRTVSAVLLDLADARLLAGESTSLTDVLDLLERARDRAHQVGDTALEATALRRTADVRRTLHERTGDLAALDAAAAALAAALRLSAPDTAEHTELLVERGAALVARARLAETPQTGRRLASDAVHVLREALARVRPQDPRLAAHRLLFGRALRLRHQWRPSLSDLFEADYVLEVAARGTTDPVVCAEAWLEVGDVQLLLDERTSSRERHDRAAACYRRAAQAAQEAGSPVLTARAYHRRAGVLAVNAGPQAALRAYRDSWEQWQRAGEARSAEALATRRRIAELESRGGPTEAGHP
ncbi:SAV_2336 N-terminal domain-related protein [Streptomyces sp. NPDC059740]|uniref:SAV_2336 N-terminal domain-related protein n=1 Tax=Streptomyces sp. NPDC059740 TaxID=3346926 RepID=UPI00364EDA8C